MPIVFCLALALAACGGSAPRAGGAAPGPRCVADIGDEEAAEIGRRIWQHESGGKLLVWWDDTCDCPSLGINNYLWFQNGHQAPFEEQFLALLRYLQARNVELPDWLRALPDAPWRDRREFFAEVLTLERWRKNPPPAWNMTPEMFTSTDSARVGLLKEFLARTVAEQARFSAQRLADALPKILAALPEGERPAIERQFYRVACSRGGLFGLVDYVNFKGEGINPKERYENPKTKRLEGWGLLQVLQGMKGRRPGAAALDAFAASAERVLQRRVANAPPERAEKERGTWLPIWLRRVRSYRLPAP